MMATIRSWLQNPVLLRETRVRMRGWRAPGMIMLYVAVLGGFMLFTLWVLTRYNSGFAPSLGNNLFNTLAVVQLMLLMFSAPGLTAGAISGERERQTLDLLLVTRMSPLQVVLGKLSAATGFVVLLVIASLPVYSILFLLGGISLSRLGLLAIVYLVTVVYLGSWGIYFSAVFKRTQAAVVASYATALLGVIATGLAALVTQQLLVGWGETPAAWTTIFAYVNPVFGFSAAAGGELFMLTTLYRKLLTTPEALQAIWWKYSLTALGISAWLLWRTSRRIQPLKEK